MVEFNRIYRDSASLSRALLARISRSNKLPLQWVALILTRAHHACTIGRLDFSAEPSVGIMRYGSITLKSAVGLLVPHLKKI
jgi:hypothetical protein